MERQAIGPMMKADDLGDRWAGIRELTEKVLADFSRLGAKQLNLRLNESNTEEKRPVFVDWIAAKQVAERIGRKSSVADDWGRSRVGDTVPSRVYEEALAGAGRKIVERNWKSADIFKEKRLESRMMVQKAGLMYQKFIALIGGDGEQQRCVGLLSLAFESKPKKSAAVDAKMKEWASWPGFPKSDLVRFAEEHFEVGGPFLKTRRRSL
ncbi:MAG TPA: hypothetical protein VGH16_20455 [Candidatus Binatia bacterium]